MIALLRWLIRFFGIAVVVLILVLWTGYRFASRSLPDYELDYSVSGISAPVEILRTNTAVPHIFGETDEDVFYGLGFAHAQDRLWQMVVMRRTAQGRLSEIFGERTVRIDETMRRLGVYSASRQSATILDDESLAKLEAYSAGVNAWIAQVNEGARGRGAPEFFLFSPSLEAWRPADSIALMKLMSLQMSPHIETEILRARVSLLLPDARVADILPDAPGDGLAALPEYSTLFPDMTLDYTALSTDIDPLSPFRNRAFVGASNAWAADGTRTVGDAPLLANDPHLDLSAPSIWYLARLELQSGGVIGGTIPGIPTVMSGRNPSLAWGVTASYLDDTDLYIEQLNPENPEEFKTVDGFAPFITRRETIHVNGGTSIDIVLRWSENGPVLPGHLYNLDSITPPGHVVAVAWTMLAPSDTSIAAALDLMEAQNISEGIEAGEGFVVPSANLVLADASGVAMKTVGAFPARNANHQSLGRIPTPGWRLENRWQGRLHYNSNPEFRNPAGGIVGTTNHKIIDRNFPFHMSFDWGDTQRVARWTHLMQSREIHSRDSFVETQLDTVSFSARTLLPLVAADLWYTGRASIEDSLPRRKQQVLDMLLDWNGDMNEHLPEPLIYAAWMRALQNRLIQDELGELADAFTHVEPLFIERVFRDIDGAGIWCDVIQSASVETCSEMADAALEDAVIWLGETYGGTIEALRWGDAHQALHDHPALGGLPFVHWIVNIQQSTGGGDNTLQRALTSGDGDEPFTNVHASGFRSVIDMFDPEGSLFIISTGQSGHLLLRHYEDLGQLWRRGEYIPMQLDPELARSASAGTTTLTPR